MADQALGLVIKTVRTVLDLIEQAKRNKEQLRLLGERIRLLQGPLNELRSKQGLPTSLTAPLRALDDTLNDCNAFVRTTSQGSSSFILDMLKAGKTKDTIVELSAVLDTKVQALHFSVSTKIAIDKSDVTARLQMDIKATEQVVTTLEQIQNRQISVKDVSSEVKELLQQSVAEMKASMDAVSQEQIEIAAAAAAQSMRADVINALQRLEDFENLPQWINKFSNGQNQVLQQCKALEDRLKGEMKNNADSARNDLAGVRKLISGMAAQQEGLVSLQSSLQGILLSFQEENRKQFEESQNQMGKILSEVHGIADAQKNVSQLNDNQRKSFVESKRRADEAQHQLALVQDKIRTISQIANSTSSSQQAMMDLLLDLNRDCVAGHMEQKAELKKLQSAMASLAASQSADVSAQMQQMESQYSSLEAMIKTEFESARATNAAMQELTNAQQQLTPSVQKLQEQMSVMITKQEQDMNLMARRIDEMIRLQLATVGSAVGRHGVTTREAALQSMSEEQKEAIVSMEMYRRDCQVQKDLNAAQFDHISHHLDTLASMQEQSQKAQTAMTVSLDQLQTEWTRENKESREQLTSILQLVQKMDSRFDNLINRVEEIAMRKGDSQDSAGSGNARSPSQQQLTSAVQEISPSELQDMQKVDAGGFGTVYRASWNMTPVAVKVVQEDHLDAKAYADFMHEAGILSNLKHANIVSLYGVCSKPPSLYMVMEYVPGNLRTVLDTQKSLSAEVKLNLSFDIARGMLYLIQLPPPMGPIIHRDLKSLNVLVDKSMKAKIADFGLSKKKTYQTMIKSANQMVGTLAWTAPEVLCVPEGVQPNFGEKTDVYSFGVVLWEIITQQKPFHGLTEVQIMMRLSQKRGLEAASGNMFGDTAQAAYPVLCSLAAQCMSFTVSERPTFKEITTILYKAISSAPSSASHSFAPGDASGSSFPSAGSKASSGAASFLSNPFASSGAASFSSSPFASSNNSSLDRQQSKSFMNSANSSGSHSSASYAFPASASANDDGFKAVPGYDALQVLSLPSVRTFWLNSFGKGVKEVNRPSFERAVEASLLANDKGNHDMDAIKSMCKTIVDACDWKKNGVISVTGVAQAERSQSEVFEPLSSDSGGSIGSPQTRMSKKAEQDTNPLLAMLSKNPEAEVDNSACKKLMALLEDQEENGPLMERALLTIGNMCKSDVNRSKLGSYGFVKAICRLMDLQELNEGLQLSACYALGNLCARNNLNRTALLENNGLSLLFSALQLNWEHTNLVKSALFSLSNLFTFEDARKYLIMSPSSSQTIMEIMSNPALVGVGEVQAFACSALANLASDDVHCVSMMTSASAAVPAASAAAPLPFLPIKQSLNITPDIHANRGNFIDSVLRMMEEHMDRAEVLTQAALLLFKISSSSMSHAVCQDLEQYDATDVIVNVMERFSSSGQLQEYACGLLSKLSASDRVQMQFVSKGGLRRILQVMQRNDENQALQLYACSVLLRLTVKESHREDQKTAGAVNVARHAVKLHGLEIAKQLIVRLTVDEKASSCYGFRNCWLFCRAPKRK